MDILRGLFESFAGTGVDEIRPLSASGSNRKYYRICGGGTSLIGVKGTDRDENTAFISIDRHFASRGLNVPKVLAVSDDGMAYIQEDLGDMSLYEAVSEGRQSGVYSQQERDLLCRTMSMLPDIQYLGGEGMDYGTCYPEPEFSQRMVAFDLNYFKYCFLKSSGLEFNEIRLQDDFDRLGADLMKDFGNTFMYRDFQARNVMIKDGEPYFIDFQGGRRGPVYYDVASFVWQARARYPEDLREDMIAAYLKALRRYEPGLDEEEFRSNLRLFVLFRTLQVLGAYGFRGLVERKPHFLASIPPALDNLRNLISTPFEEYPYLSRVLSELVGLDRFNPPAPSEDGKLEVKVYSFSFKKGIPEDRSGNGGGYVFDCRDIINPANKEERDGVILNPDYLYYRTINGRDRDIIDYIEKKGSSAEFAADYMPIDRYLDCVYSLVDAHVDTYLRRGFTSLQLCFGCTGGQHRSVYCAQHVAEHLAERYKGRIHVRLIHREQGIEETL